MLINPQCGSAIQLTRPQASRLHQQFPESVGCNLLVEQVVCAREPPPVKVMGLFYIKIIVPMLRILNEKHTAGPTADHVWEKSGGL